jgi:ParB family chromosome partitioning protein
MLRLQTLPDRVREHIHAGRLSAGHARALVGHHDAERLADEIVARGLNVREVEEIARTTGAKSGKQQIKGAEAHARAMKNANTLALERRLSDALGLAVSIDHRERGGTLSVRYRSLDQLDEVVRRLERKH